MGKIIQKKGGLREALQKHLVKAKKEESAKKSEKERERSNEKRKAQIKEILQPMHSWTDGSRSLHPFRPNATVLLVGDGDLSFALSLARIISANGQIIPTVYDDRQALLAKYPQAAQHIAALHSHANVQPVQYEVDAANIHRLPHADHASVVIFNFPHTGSGIKDRQRNILGNQKLVLDFLKSASIVLSRCGQYGEKATFTTTCTPARTVQWATDERMQPQVHITVKNGEPYDAWNVKKLARSVGFRCCQSFSFCPDRYPGYRHCRTDGGREDYGEWAARGATTMVFTLGDSACALPTNGSDED